MGQWQEEATAAPAPDYRGDQGGVGDLEHEWVEELTYAFFGLTRQLPASIKSRNIVRVANSVRHVGDVYRPAKEVLTGRRGSVTIRLICSWL